MRLRCIGSCLPAFRGLTGCWRTWSVWVRIPSGSSAGTFRSFGRRYYQVEGSCLVVSLVCRMRMLTASIPLAAASCSSLTLRWMRPAAEAAQTGGSSGGRMFLGRRGVFERVKGVTDAVSGFAGGEKTTAHYERVSEGDTGHAESVKIDLRSLEDDLWAVVESLFRGGA